MNHAKLYRGWLVLRKRPLLVALLVGLVLRLIGLESRSLAYDDTFSIFLSARSLPEIFKGTAADTMPPLYYLMLHYWMLIAQWAMAGQSAWFIRLLSVLLNLLVIVILYRLAECWLGRPTAAWASLLAAISPLLIYHGQDVRMYTLLVANQLGYLWFFTRIWFSPDEGRIHWIDWAGLVLCGVAAMYSHNVAIFAILVPNLFLLFCRDWKKIIRLIAAQVVIALLALPWLLYLPGQITKVQKAWTLPRPGLAELLQAVIMFTASLPLPLPLLALALLLSLQILVMLIIELWRGRRGQERSLLFWLVLLLLPPGMLLAASFVVKPMFIPRAFLVSCLAYEVLAGWVITRTWSSGVGKLLAGAFVLAALISLPSYYTYNQFPRSPYREAAQYLKHNTQIGDIIVHETKLSYFPVHFYALNLSQMFLADPVGSPNDTFEPDSQKAMQIFPQKDLASAVAAEATANTGKDIYFLTFTQTFLEYKEMGLAEPPNLQWLNQHYHFVGRVVFDDLVIYQYER